MTIENVKRPRVWCIGLGRTGTRSFCDAMKILGYKNVRHVPPYIQDLDDAEAAAEGICMSHFQYLDIRFPNSKFVLSTRDLDTWLNSCQRAIADFPKERIPSNSPFYNAMVRNRVARYGAIEFDRPKLIERYYHHHFDVVAYFKESFDKLLITDFTKNANWNDICSFLGTQIPEIAFPHISGKTGIS